ncbi:NAD(P)-dependent oxidoreductase [Streptomyces litchfieldiae]|uniref:NAD(P)-binding domain-containing protein n=1 Tax=Streptomyces litchfieldiae TaxID=3075543 RepID=A0ABU2MKB8_9ACTN|nr:NAD(P)-binding domain-containing protein [Streptomyces sp. DSM 44938]MDT0342048.1 NAD(P)-binding domain-containing protein [Streptomyces sp. DSM 44938]
MTDRTPAAPAVTLLGLGAMGTALADALLSGGHDVTVWNRTAARAEPLAARGARTAGLEEAITASPLVIACLLDHASVHETLDPVAASLTGRTLVNLTNGTPEQGRELAAWAEKHGIAFLDGGIMATPPMIGHPGASILYSGAREAFDTHQATLERFGVADFLGTDPGLAALVDLALLSGMYGLFGGALQALALTGSEGISATEFTTTRLLPWLNAMLTSLPEIARQTEEGAPGDAANSNLAMQAAAYVNILDASEAQGIRPDLMVPMGELLHRAVAAGQGGKDAAAMVTLLAKEA